MRVRLPAEPGAAGPAQPERSPEEPPAPARPCRGKGRRGLLQPCPCPAAPPLPFPVLPAGAQRERDARAPPRAAKRGRAGQGAAPSAPPRPAPERPRQLPGTARAPQRSSRGGGGLSPQRSPFRALPEAGTERGKGSGSCHRPPRGPSACRSNEFCAQDTADTRFGDSTFVGVQPEIDFPPRPGGAPG